MMLLLCFKIKNNFNSFSPKGADSAFNHFMVLVEGGGKNSHCFLSAVANECYRLIIYNYYIITVIPCREQPAPWYNHDADLKNSQVFMIKLSIFICLVKVRGQVVRECLKKLLLK